MHGAFNDIFLLQVIININNNNFIGITASNTDIGGTENVF